MSFFLKEAPVLSSHLAPDAPIVHCPDFESAIVKLQMEDENLTEKEASAVQVFRNVTVDAAASVVTPSVEATTYEDKMRLAVEAKKAGRGRSQKYRSTFHISPTSNIVERLFSRAGIIMSPRRRQMDPSTLEMFLMLRVNKHMWGEETLQCIIDKNKAAAREKAIERSKRKRIGEGENDDNQEDVENF